MSKNQMKKYHPLYCISGTVTRGVGIGKHVGTPTANLSPYDSASILKQNLTASGPAADVTTSSLEPGRKKLPEPGVYLSKVSVDGQTCFGITHIGPRPTLSGDGDYFNETLILDFNREIYGHPMTVRLYRFLRHTQKFDTLSLLLDQIRRDGIAARKFWEIAVPHSHLSMDPGSRTVSVGDEKIELPAKEFSVLYLLFSSPGTVFTKEEIYETVWQEPANDCLHPVENTLFQIRRRLRPLTDGHDPVRTVIGYGYRFDP